MEERSLTKQVGVPVVFPFPTSDEFANAEDPWLRISRFEHGYMTVNVDTGEVRQIGPDPSAPEETVLLSVRRVRLSAPMD